LTPEQQAAQIMAIYPIIKGQQFSQKNAIPPRASFSEPHAGPKDLHSDGGDLIDFAAESPPSQLPLAKTPQAAPGTGANDGPLIDYQEDLKRDLPDSLRRIDSTESEDEFVDAQG